MLPTDLAYLAGVIDSDGFIGVQRQNKPQRVYFAARLGIVGKRREPHDLAASLFGGNVRQYDGVFQWTRHGEAALEPLRLLLPYLRVKPAQARLALLASQASIFDVEEAVA